MIIRSFVTLFKPKLVGVADRALYIFKPKLGECVRCGGDKFEPEGSLL